MAIVGVPGWIGESAVNETGQRWMDAAMKAVRVSVPGWMSSMAGQSKEVYYSIGASNSYNKDTLINWIKAQGSTPVVITITGNIVSSSTGQPCLDFPSSLTNAYVTLNINSGVHVWGRGGNGGDAGAAGGKCNIRGQGSEYNGGAAGKAVTGNAPSWTKVGTIYGSRV